MTSASDLSCRRIPALLLSLATVACGAASAAAQDWPARQPIKVVVPATAGSTADIMARTMFEQVGRQLGQSVITENRSGAGTTTGMAYVAKSAPDGYTVLVNSTSYVVVASTYAKLSYDPYDDMTGVALLAHLPFLVAASTRYRTLAELITAGRATPTPLNYGTTGAGSSSHLFVERLLRAGHAEARHVPFRGTPEVMTEIVAGRLDMAPAPIPSLTELAGDKRVAVLAIATPRRSSVFPDVPTTIEAGYPDSDYDFWMGSYVPAQTPVDIVRQLHAEIAKALQDKSIQDKIRVLGGEIEPMSTDQFNAFIARERKVNAEIVKLIGYVPQ